ncbi:M24 family metallopeptidase [Telmatobacter bradus]|uniref:M24 family metallopeptidase n=1 Tax=Telmatobacter bradus TaxID=474953 RepID=UPI003B4329CB
MTVAAPATRRIEKLQKEMVARGIDVLICFKPENTFYISGFNPIIYSHPVIAIVPATGDSTLLVHALRDDHARTSTWIADIRLYGSWSTKVTICPNWLDALQLILEELHLTKAAIGIEEDYLPVGRLKSLEQILPQATFANASGVIFRSRVIKDETEIASARIAAHLADRGMTAAIDTLAAGGSERDVATAAMRTMNETWNRKYPEVEVCAFGSLEGGVQNALWCWCLSGKRVLINCDSPSVRRPERGEIALTFIWAIANGIYVENERSVAIGALATEQQRAYDAILQIREETRPLIRPGARVADLFLAVRSAYQRLGYGKYLPGRIGHGMGLGAHEEPSLDGKSDLVFEPGMIFTFEPNLRIPEWGGLQHSDTLLITPTGHESLTITPNGFLQVQV